MEQLCSKEIKMDDYEYERELLHDRANEEANLLHPGWCFYGNTHGGDRYKRIQKDFPDLVLIDKIARDIYGNLINGVAIFTTSHEQLNKLLNSGLYDDK
jgi:hypothetical protein